MENAKKTENQSLIREARMIVREVNEAQMRSFDGRFKGRGIVTCAGGYQYFTNAWILINMLRHRGCRLPIELWHYGEQEMDDKMRRMIHALDVQCLDVTPFCDKPGRSGWALKTAAIARSSFEEVLFLDADNVPVRDPSFLFNIPQYKKSGILFWPGDKLISGKHPFLNIFGLDYKNEPEVELGQLVINKRLGWEPLVFAEQLNLRSDVFHRLECGGEELFRSACRKLGNPYAMPESPPQMLTTGDAQDAVLCQHDFTGERLFQHRMFCKWDLLGGNPWVGGFFFESQCHIFLDELKKRWDGRCGVKDHRFRPASLVQCERSLMGKPWRLELSGPVEQPRPHRKPNASQPALKASLPDFVQAPPNLTSINVEGRAADIGAVLSTTSPAQNPNRFTRELEFARNGTLKKGADPTTGLFWELSAYEKGMQLLLSSENRGLISLKRITKDCWKGSCIDGSMAGRDVTLSTIESIIPNLARAVKGRSTQSIRQEIVRTVGKQIHVTCSGAELSDHIMATYACTGLSRFGVDVTFHTSQSAWLSRVAEPGLVITKKPRKGCRDLNYDYWDQMRYGASRASWYASGLHPLLAPARPGIELRGVKRRFPFDKYILLKPCSENRNQMWPETHWTRLANLLRGEGYELIAFGTENQAGTLLRIFSQTQTYWVVGQSPEWIVDALLGAKAYVGIDHGITHLAGLLGVKTVAIHSQFPGSFLWTPAKVASVTPSTDCTFCRWQFDRGYLQSCEAGCSALATVSPEAVASALLKLLDKK
jgi:hypothetical protein